MELAAVFHLMYKRFIAQFHSLPSVFSGSCCCKSVRASAATILESNPISEVVKVQTASGDAGRNKAGALRPQPAAPKVQGLHGCSKLEAS
jgi:hypothetical protein